MYIVPPWRRCEQSLLSHFSPIFLCGICLFPLGEFEDSFSPHYFHCTSLERLR